MKPTSFAVKASLVASMILSGQAFAQNLPDEINHPHYLRIYENLQTVLSQKIAEYEKLNEQKITIEKTIAQMEKDQVELPARNNELNRIISNLRAESARLDGEIQGLEGVLGKIIEDLRRLDNMIAQLQRDLQGEGNRANQIEQRRNQVAHDVAQINARLQREINEENQSIGMLNRLNGEFDAAINRTREIEQERAAGIRDNDRFRTEIPKARNEITQNTNALNTKKPQLTEAQSKLPGVKSELASEEAKLAQIDVVLNPKKKQLNDLKAELARLSPNIARLQAENKTLEQKIAANTAAINNTNINALISRRDSLESEISGVKAQIQSNNARMIELQEAIKPTIGQINDLTVKMREALRRRDMVEAARLKKEIDELEATIAPQKQESLRLSKQTEQLAVSIAPKQNEINNLNTQITQGQTRITALQNEIDDAKVKIAENDKKILEESQANAGLAQQIATLQAEVNALESQREPTAKKVTSLKAEEAQLTNRISVLSSEVQKLEQENTQLAARIAQMEKFIADHPELLRRQNAHIRTLAEKQAELRGQIDREQRLLQRIRQDRVVIQQERDRAQAVLDQTNMDLANTDRLIGALRNKLLEEQRSREALTRYNQDSIRKLDGLKVAKANTEKEISLAIEELRINNQDLATISSDLPKLRSELGAVSPKVAAAESARNSAQTNVNNANSQYQNRLSLYQNYLTEAQKLGADKASIGTTDGAKAGSIDAKTKANKLGSENASLEGKWEAIRRGYVRGEIAGFRSGFEIGMSSTADAERGEAEGRIAGARRAKDHANMVIKPQKYLEELERRLREDETSGANPQMARLLKQELKTIQAMAREALNNIPDLSSAELAESAKIVSSLDALIAQSDLEIKEVLELRKKLSDARAVYSAPAAGENQNNVNCSAVYKGVRDFIEACKGSYVIRYQSLYNSAHSDTFNKEYGPAFRAQLDSVFESELSRLYPTYLAQATKIGNDVGVSTGKREIYQQTFNRAENIAYGGTLPNEVARVETEAVNLVQEHLNQNAALTLKGNAKLSTANIFGISPGADVDLKMMIKNIGSKDSSGNSLVRITEISSNISAERRDAPLAAVAANSHADLSVIKLKVNEASLPGSKVVLAGEVVHPGNHYRANRTESFRIETVLAVNPAIDSSVEFDSTPKVSSLFGTKKHDIDLKIKPKYAGVDRGYELVLEEVGSNFVEITSRPAATEVLGRGVEKKVSFTYKLQKASRGKTVTMKLTVKNDGKIVSEQTIQVKPE